MVPRPRGRGGRRGSPRRGLADFADARTERAISETAVFLELRQALHEVPVGGTTDVVDEPNGFLVSRRLR